TMRNSGWPNSTGSPFSTKISAIVPETSASISFMSFIASTMQRVCPFCTVWPTSTNGGDSGERALSNVPTKGEVTMWPGFSVGAGAAAAGAGAGAAAASTVTTGAAAVATTASLPRRMVNRSPSPSYSKRVMSDFSSASMIALIFSTSTRASLYPSQVLAGAGVDLDRIALVDEQRNLDDETGLELGGLERAGDGVSPHTGIALDDLEFHRVGQRHADRLAPVEEDVDLRVLLEEVLRVAEHVLGEEGLVVGLLVHEVVVRPLLVEELHRTLLEVGTVELLAGPEVLLQDVARDERLVLGANEGATLAGLHVLELDDLVGMIVDLDLQAIAKLAGIDDVGHDQECLSEGGASVSEFLEELGCRHAQEVPTFAEVPVRDRKSTRL